MKDCLRIAVFPGDGIGPEITGATVGVLEALAAQFGINLDFTEREIGLARLESDGTTFSPQLLELARKSDGILLGPISHAIYPARDKGGINVSAELRTALDLYSNIRPARSRPGIPHYGRTPMDLVIVRENTEGFYADRNFFRGPGEWMPTPDLAIAMRKISAQACRRIARSACELALRRRKHVTAVHKANVLHVTEGLFLGEVRAVAAELRVELEEQLVDSMAAMLVRDAARFDVIVTTNMFGDILSDEASELAGSLGLAGSINCGDSHCMAQAQHGSAPDIAGKNIANPASLILSAAMMLEWLGGRRGDASLLAAGAALQAAVDSILEQPASRTRDLGGSLGTKEFAAAVAETLSR